MEIKRLALIAFLAATTSGLDAQVPGRAVESAPSAVPPARELRPIPPAEYAKLSKGVFRAAQAHSGPVISNPKGGNNGLDPAVTSALEQQRAFLMAHALLNVSRPSVPQGQAVNQRGVVRPPISRAPNSMALARPVLADNNCRQAGVQTVNGRLKGVVFTPKAPDNHYKIQGCFFGDQRGHVQLRLDPMMLGESPKLLELSLEAPFSWSDTEIDAYVNANVTGLRDFIGKATLQILTAKNQIIELPGCSFVAARSDPQMLTLIPSTWVSLQPTKTPWVAVQKLEYVSPVTAGGDTPNDAIGTSAMVVRADSQRFAAGTDSFDFSHLLNDWEVVKVQPITYAVSCPGVTTYSDNNGNWNLGWDEKKVVFNWKEDYCTSYVPPFFGYNMSLSQYALKVWVQGPMGTPFMASNSR